MLTVARVVMQPLGYRVFDAGKMLGVGRTTAFNMIRDGRQIAGATVVTHESIERVCHAAEPINATKRARGACEQERGGSDVSDDKPKWDTPDNAVSSKTDEAGDLARKHGISPDRAQMLIERYGHDPEQLDAAAEKLRPKG